VVAVAAHDRALQRIVADTAAQSKLGGKESIIVEIGKGRRSHQEDQGDNCRYQRTKHAARSQKNPLQTPICERSARNRNVISRPRE